MNVIFGSGIIGLLAKKILAGNWTVVPFKRSRFYSFNPPLADNCISSDKALDPVLADIAGSNERHLYRRAYSAVGTLVTKHDPNLCNAWLSKVFGKAVPSHGLPYLTTRLSFPIYGIRVHQLYTELMIAKLDYLKRESSKGEVTGIGDHYYIQGGVRVEFERAISTIPLHALLALVGQPTNLPSLREHYVHIMTKTIDLEGANQALVVDANIDFYKVTNVSPHRYVIYSMKPLDNLALGLLPVLGPVDVLDGTAMDKAIPAGEIPDLSVLERLGIFCIGSDAQHDPFMDVGSCLLRLVNYAYKHSSPA